VAITQFDQISSAKASSSDYCYQGREDGTKGKKRKKIAPEKEDRLNQQRTNEPFDLLLMKVVCVLTSFWSLLNVL
jgi:hypothetical protein